MTTAATFTRLALAELSRRGLAAAATVVAVNDGAAWIQSFLDLHCPGAVRVLDFAHAAGYLAQAAQAAFGPGTAATSAWFSAQRHELRHGAAERVLTAVAALPPSAERDPALGYLTPRRAMLAYPGFDTAGLPVGSGCVERANKLVIEARLQGAGMHWTRDHADALVGLRTIVGTDRWAGCWTRIRRAMHADRRQRAAQRRRARARPAAPSAVLAAAPSAPSPRPPTTAAPLPRPKLIVDGKPTTAHPWKRFPACASAARHLHATNK